MINQLKIYNVGEKIRIGNTYDGGYVISKQMLEDSECLFSYGINNEISFDEDYIRHTGKKVYGYDHTINGVQTQYPNLFKWYKKGLSGTPRSNTDNFINHYKQLGISGRVLLKVDVEECEYEWLQNTDLQELAKITTGLVLEMHEIHREDVTDKFINCLTELNKHFYLCHVHGNNYGPTFNYQGCNVPIVAELTFIPKDIVKEVSDSTEIFPTKLDNPNDSSIPDINLDFILFNTLGGAIHTIDSRDYSRVLKRAFDNNGDIVDVGCYDWEWSQIFLGKKRVIGVDPIENHIPEGAELFKGAIGSNDGKVLVDINGVKSTIIPTQIDLNNSVEVDMITWKTFCNNYNIDKISVLKINIEGSEYALLDSLTSDDFDKIDQIAVSFHDWLVPEWGNLTQIALSKIKNAGFKLIKINEPWNWYLAYKP